MRKIVSKIIPLMFIGVIVLLSLSTTIEATNGYKYGAKTPPPPVEEMMTTHGFFNSNHNYLLDGSNLLTIDNSKKMRLEGTTFGKRTVNSIGITFSFQKWNGSSWKTVGKDSDYSGSNQDVYDKTVLRNAEKGYYYRLKTKHWISHNGEFEKGETVSDHILMK